MGGGGDAVNTEDQQVLILLHECLTETSRHAKRGELSPLCPSVLLSLPTCRTLTLFFLHWWICVPQHSSRELQRQSQLSFWPVTFFVWNDWALLTLLSWHFIGLYWSAKPFNFVLWLFVSQINLKHEETHQTRLSSTPYLFLLINYIIVTKTTIIHPSPQCSSSLSSCCSGFDISLHMTSIIQSHH